MITINIDKAKLIAHAARRAARAKEFEPHDATISKQIPGTSAAEAEAARQVIRERYALVQASIDGASDAGVLAGIVHGLTTPWNGLYVPPTSPVASPAPAEAPVAPPVVEEPVVAPLEADPAAGLI